MIDKAAILDAFHFRHACKTFDPDKSVSDADFRFILETGRLSPSSFGLEPWRFLVIQDKALREKLLAVTWGAKGQFPTASHVVAILVRKDDMIAGSDFTLGFMREVQHHPEEVIARRTAVLRQFQEGDFNLDSVRARFDWSCRQAYIALANMMTAAAMIGIDSCPIEGFNQAGADAILAEAGHLEGGRFGLAVMVAFGYRINPQPAKTRQNLDQVVRWA
ncbi:MAG: NAD(P)H-dependent oxidoreductase [Pseudomonadota bacterium]